MQAVKSQLWTSNKNSFVKKVNHRVNEKPEKFILGTHANFMDILSEGKRLRFIFTIVQPGISGETLSVKLSSILAAADDAIQNNGNEALRVLGF